MWVLTYFWNLSPYFLKSSQELASAFDAIVLLGRFLRVNAEECIFPDDRRPNYLIPGQCTIVRPCRVFRAIPAWREAIESG
ncbi:MAG: hypothetical protein F6J87_14905 [Spirulina sp. SIO3F2]|nr:hypothetical protein [Spirulina sp. SIO3F2]